jgi:peroxiredoxin
MKNIQFQVVLIILLSIPFTGCAQSSDTLPDSRGYMVRLGNTAPDFIIQFTDGSSSKKLSDFRGNVVMLQFTASWCGVCIEEMPHIENEIWQAFKSKGLYVFGVDRKETKEQIIKFAGKTKVTYPLIMDETGEIFNLYAHPKAGVTRNILIDKNGKIVFMTRLYDEKEFGSLIEKIKSIL